MLKIRLTRVGSKNNPHYRLILVPARTKRNTKALEILGFFNPKTKEMKFDNEKIKQWREKGAQLSETVQRLLGEKPKRDYSKNKRVLEKQAKLAEKKEVAPAKTEAEKATEEPKETPKN
ncbi:30S ribosomal protein S16 [candidate division CPR3 bacterium GWF2_35_18]|uniref:Small ribosomal subunit protein bS16 n=1 Tax=candidate division CPR3 bacterium GW2011_GWF2_35_18 TaxID=1618350 RepID=A0A0G0BKK0_UNCC3|nr:MAG: 30S ribosomal protein S16 [candidate division CPR3 bacterium GW2011_GWF2_35_18]KKP86383.1 MAG: 30S ribosomal protein S16 [candidate division CPR3 bacterium GW2011_GWE2_35_7]OGB62776.1 MAG: 30S ribosomal protein S16 [candidate division CPR3 bacterium GWF2_35_18]OGB65357.1 MAG: 30S ribosomal protein S16 [candidate division CPR3 bacterium RIFOXYA2_FULL_35_13]OGB77029.1 MAG: 30S ribosomal protein S16 [candidate division CPR3 bacterium RIFOXYC2_FULL_35_7]OGB79138.1 MAG: 30S ribosomal protei